MKAVKNAIIVGNDGDFGGFNTGLTAIFSYLRERDYGEILCYTNLKKRNGKAKTTAWGKYHKIVCGFSAYQAIKNHLTILENTKVVIVVPKGFDRSELPYKIRTATITDGVLSHI